VIRRFDEQRHPSRTLFGAEQAPHVSRDHCGMRAAAVRGIRGSSEYLPHERGDLLRVVLIHFCEYRPNDGIVRDSPIELREECGQT
jgi:hypothetical protein